MKTEDRHWVWDMLEFIVWLAGLLVAGVLALCLATLPKQK